MEQPLALRLVPGEIANAYRVRLADGMIKGLKVRAGVVPPAVVVTRTAAVMSDLGAAMIDAADIVAMSPGDWKDAVLIVLPGSAVEERVVSSSGDAAFLEAVERAAPHLKILASQTLSAIRDAGVDGDLIEAGGGRWVNRPTNSFTLKAQPRAGNLHFTLYGGPDTYEAGDFLLKDQNSYSRGWVRNVCDTTILAELARRAHERRQR